MLRMKRRSVLKLAAATGAAAAIAPRMAEAVPGYVSQNAELTCKAVEYSTHMIEQVLYTIL